MLTVGTFNCRHSKNERLGEQFAFKAIAVIPIAYSSLYKVFKLLDTFN